MADLPLLLSSFADLKPDHLVKFYDWYAGRHAQDMVDVGFISTNHYICRRGSPMVCSLYEFSSYDLIDSEAFHVLSTEDPDLPKITSGVFDRTRAPYRQVLARSVSEAGDARARARGGYINAPVITKIRFAADPKDDDAITRWHTSEFARLSQIPGFIAARLCFRERNEREKPMPTVPRWLAIGEWASIEAAEAYGTSGNISLRYRQALPISDFRYNQGIRVIRAAM